MDFAVLLLVKLSGVIVVLVLLAPELVNAFKLYSSYRALSDIRNVISLTVCFVIMIVLAGLAFNGA